MKKKGFPKGSVCKPCWELRYCPYGYLVEYFPILSKNYDIDEIKAKYEDSLKNFTSGKLKTEEDV